MWKLFKIWLLRFIKEHGKAFWGGSIAGGVAIGGWVFSIPDFLDAFWIVFAGKMFATICSAALTGFFTSLVSDLYKHKWKHKFFNKEKINQNGQSDKEKAA